MKCALFTLLMLAAEIASATWSIVATNPETREVGAAGATCNVGIEYIIGMVPGKGVILAQAATNLSAKQKGMEIISDGGTPIDVINAVANQEFNPGGMLSAPWTKQQYGVAVLDSTPMVAHFTGSDTVPWSGAIASDTVSSQGNMLVSEAVITSSMTAWDNYLTHSPEACPFDMADRLLTALKAGALEGGDIRCPSNKAALTAFVTVSRPTDTLDNPSLLLVAPKAYGLLGSIRHWVVPYSQDEEDPSPIDLLQQMYAGWKEKHPHWQPACEATKAQPSP